MEKTFLLCGLLYATSGLAFGNHAYLGVGVGSVGGFLKNYSVDNFGRHNSRAGGNEQGTVGWSGDVYLGYFYTVNHVFNIAAQVDALISSIDIDKSNTKTHTTAGTSRVNTNSKKYRYSYGISARPGLMLKNKTNGFAVLGFRRSRWKYRAHKVSSTAGTVTRTASLNHNGFEYGLGLSTAVAYNVDLRIEATQTRYKRKATVRNFHTFDHKPMVNQALLSVLWKTDIV